MKKCTDCWFCLGLQFCSYVSFMKANKKNQYVGAFSAHLQLWIKRTSNVIARNKNTLVLFWSLWGVFLFREMLKWKLQFWSIALIPFGGILIAVLSQIQQLQILAVCLYVLYVEIFIRIGVTRGCPRQDICLELLAFSITYSKDVLCKWCNWRVAITQSAYLFYFLKLTRWPKWTW